MAMLGNEISRLQGKKAIRSFARKLAESEVIKEVMLKPMPKGVFIGMDELAGITGFLISPAARNISGQAIVVDGGWTAQ